MPRAVATAAPMPDDSADALAKLGGVGSTIYVYRVQANGRRAFVRQYTPDEFSEAAVAEHFGGGQYLAQVRNTDGTNGAGRSFDIDGAIRPARRIGFGAGRSSASDVLDYPQPQQQADPFAAITARLDRIEQGGVPQGPTMQPTWRDMMEMMRAQQPAAQTTTSLGDIMKMLPVFIELVKPKSTVGEMYEAAKLMKYLGKSGMADAAEGGGGGGFDLAGILNSPLGSALAEKVLESRTPATSPNQPHASVQTAPALPAPTPPPTPPPFAFPDDVRKSITMAAPLLLAALQSPEVPTAPEIAEGVLNAFDMPEDKVHVMLAAAPEGALAVVVMQAEPRLQPFAAKLIVAEGVLREMVRPDDSPDDPPAPLPFTPAEPAAVAPPTPAPAAAPRAPTSKAKPRKGRA